MLLTNLFQSLREHAIASNSLEFAEKVIPESMVRSLRYLEFDEAGQQLKALLEKGYTDGIDGLEDVRIEGNKIKGVFFDKVTSGLTKRYEFTIDEDGVSYKLLNPNAVEKSDAINAMEFTNPYRDDRGRFASKNSNSLKKIEDSIFEKTFKQHKEDGSYEYMILGNAQTYSDILKSQGKDAADKAYESHVRKISRTMAQKAYKKDVNSYKSIMERGLEEVQKLDLELSNAKDNYEKFKIMRRYRSQLIKNGISKQKSSNLVASKKFDPSISDEDKKNTINAAISFYQIAKGMGESALDVFKLDELRAYANSSAKSINIGVFTRAETIYHEMGHHIEFEDEKIAEAARKWRDDRSTGDAVSLNNLVPGANYKDTEKAKPGKYINPYVGKVYDDGATEVVSMGIQNFHSPESMLSFYEQDKEHFQFIVGVIKRD